MLQRNITITVASFLLFLSGCALSVDTRVLDFGSDKTTETFTLTVQSPVEWSITCNKPWVSITPDSGQVEGTHNITVTVERAGLKNGFYTARLHISTDSHFPCPDVIVTMSVIKPPSPSEGISLYKPVDRDRWYAGSLQTIEWVSAAELKNEQVKIEIIGDNLAISDPILEVETENTGSYKINSFGKGTLDDHTVWTTPLLKGTCYYLCLQ